MTTSCKTLPAHLAKYEPNFKMLNIDLDARTIRDFHLVKLKRIKLTAIENNIKQLKLYSTSFQSSGGISLAGVVTGLSGQISGCGGALELVGILQPTIAD